MQALVLDASQSTTDNVIDSRGLVKKGLINGCW